MRTKGIKAMTALLFNLAMGVMMTALLGVPALAGAATAVGVSLVPPASSCRQARCMTAC